MMPTPSVVADPRQQGKQTAHRTHITLLETAPANLSSELAFAKAAIVELRGTNTGSAEVIVAHASSIAEVNQ